MKLKDIEEFFDSVELPTEPVRLNSGEICIDAEKMVQTHIETLKENRGNKVFLPYYDRLMMMVKYIKEKHNNQ